LTIGARAAKADTLHSESPSVPAAGGVVTLAACLVPALRAAQISPLAVLADQ
jgi:hypothetical protein